VDRDVAAQLLSALNKLNSSVARCAKALEAMAADEEPPPELHHGHGSIGGGEIDELVSGREPQQPF
jgi:hypothetical protein